MTTFRLDADDPKLPANATAGDIVTYGDDAYRLYEDPQRGLRMWRVNVAEISAQLDAHYDSMVAAERVHPDRPVRKTDLEMTQDAASNRWGY